MRCSVKTIGLSAWRVASLSAFTAWPDPSPSVYCKIMIPHATNVIFTLTVTDNDDELSNDVVLPGTESDIESFSDMWNDSVPCDKVIIGTFEQQLWVQTSQGQRQTTVDFEYFSSKWKYQCMFLLKKMLDMAPIHGFFRTIRTARILDLHIGHIDCEDDDGEIWAKFLQESWLISRGLRPWSRHPKLFVKGCVDGWRNIQPASSTYNSLSVCYKPKRYAW
ncbi:hypothetical protein FA15DRAFT_653406 [Coprinopsis marcescibilis]|uniref:Uncharacterized protein n=1 Tax=Coprinopsis marcescibilis TaxID=230819 RepID=A0A5C3L4P2_COPMA|nr:hypothetical protein FA15DRAFT_653406 [Coprinopsis marcescibilis]